MEKVKRPFLLTGLIIDITIFGILFIFMLISSDILLVENFTIETLLFILLLCLTITGIIFSSFGLAVVFKPFEIINKKKAFVLTTFIFTCVIILFGLIGLMFGDLVNMFLILLFIATITGAVFTMIGYVKEIGSTQYATINKETFDPFEEAYAKIEKLTKLKEQNVINEEEFEILKQKQINILKKQ